MTSGRYAGDNLNIRRLISMSIEDRMNATAKNIEGKVQEVVGEVTGNPQDKVEGQEKQEEAQVQHSVENVKDDLKKMID
jgi:uncharacterized protein YjbJ (UPF0337 family)